MSIIQVDPMIPEGINDVHLADLAPRYMSDKSIGNSIYNGSYQGKDVRKLLNALLDSFIT